MNPMSNFVSFVFIAQTSMLVITTVLLVYPTVAYARNVAHTRGLLLLAAAFLSLTFSYVASIPLELSLVSAVFDFSASVFTAAGIWQFARPFVRMDDRDVETTTADDASGGFESARGD
ncbi:hypothetical protein [Halorussus pelagicus]|uniref:hypothetical protein n=1 Tax=Halorussus pelagicus TaxID=2505977 RepID=UPI001408AB3D|nr:hypothetical protein [Halorussus pelagicus]